MAKSFVCVQNMANNPALAVFVGFVTKTLMIKTRRNTISLETNIPKMNIQLTDDKSSLHKEINIKEGRENLPTKVFNPEVSRCTIMCVRPAMYLKKEFKMLFVLFANTFKNCNRSVNDDENTRK